MESEYSRETDSSKETKEAQVPPAPSLSTRGQINMSAPLPPEPSEPIPPETVASEQPPSIPETKPPAAVVTDEQPAPSISAPPPPTTPAATVPPVTEKPTAPVQTSEMYERPKENPLPRPDNLETEEVSGSKEIGLGRDDGLSAITNAPVDDPTAAGRRRIQEALKPAGDSTQQADPVTTPSAEVHAPAAKSPLSANDSTLPPVSPPLPSDASDTAPSPVAPLTPPKTPSDDLIKFRTDYPTDDLGGTANEINAENADINKANRELFEARKEAERIQAETGMSMEEYLKDANLRLLNPELFVSTDSQEVLNSNIPVSPSLPITDKTNPSVKPKHSNDSVVLLNNESLPADRTTSIPPVSPSIPGYMSSTDKEKLTGDWKNLGIINVPVADLPDPDGVNSPDDFNHHISWEDAKSAALQLPQIQKEVALGKTGDDFYAEDQAAGLDWQHGRKRVYDLYYSNTDPIQVDKDGGQYTINSGRHRIFTAKQLGLETIPARVKEKNYIKMGQSISDIKSDSVDIIQEPPSSLNMVTMPKKFEDRKAVDDYYDKCLITFGNSKNYEKFQKYIEDKGISLQDISEKDINRDFGGNFPRYLTYVHGLAEDAGIDPSTAGSIVHRMAELHTLHRYPDEVASGTRLVEQKISYIGADGKLHHKEIDRVTVQNGVHHIQDIKPIHLGEFAETAEGAKWAEQMALIHGDGFRDKIKHGKISPFQGLEEHAEIRQALRNFSRDDVSKYKIQLETYRQLYQKSNPNVKTAKPSVQPYYVW